MSDRPTQDPLARTEPSDRPAPFSGPAEAVVIGERYRLVRKLGEGGMGVVWEATHTVTGRAVAVKLMRPVERGAAEAQGRFLREARLAAGIEHRGFVPVHDVFQTDDGTLAMVMDLLRGESLGARLSREGKLSVPDAAAILAPVAEALAFAHVRGVVHRDLKPENIFLTRDGDGRQTVKVLDLGVAKVRGDVGRLDGVETRTGAAIGTPFYMAPEQLLGDPDVDGRVDAWALGVVLYEILSGVPPTRASNLPQIVQIVLERRIVPLAERVPGLPLAVTTLTNRLLAYDRTERPSDLAEVALELATLAHGDSPDARSEVIPLPLAATVPFVAATPATTADPVVAPAPERLQRRGRTKSLPRMALVAVGLVVAAAWGLVRHRSRAPLTNTTAAPTASSSSAVPSGQRSTPSRIPEAQAEYEHALLVLDDGSDDPRLSLMKAVELDPDFGAAWLRLYVLAPAFRVGEHLGDPAVDAKRDKLLGQAEAAVYRLRSSLSAYDEQLLVAAGREGEASKFAPFAALHPEDKVAQILALTDDGGFETKAAALLEQRNPGAWALAIAAIEMTLRNEPLDAPLARRLVAACNAGASFEPTPCIRAEALLADSEGRCAVATRLSELVLSREPRSVQGRLDRVGAGAGAGLSPELLEEQLGADLLDVPQGSGLTVEESLYFFRGDFERVIAKRSPQVAGGLKFSETWANHKFVVAAMALPETGDWKTAGEVAMDLVEHARLGDTFLGRALGVAAHAGMIRPEELERRRAALFDAVVARGQSAGDAWATVYAASAFTADDAMRALRRAESLDVKVTHGNFWGSARGRVLFLAGRYAEARPLISRWLTPCSTSFVNPVVWHELQLDLGEIEEHDGNKDAACEHYRLAVEHWEHPKPRSVTAERARDKAKRLGCSL